MRQSWTDDRLDNLNEKVDRRFDEVDRRLDHADRETQRRFDEAAAGTQWRFDGVCRRLDRIDERFAELKADNGEMTSRLDSVQRAVVYLAVSLTAGIIAGFAAICVLIATQL